MGSSGLPELALIGDEGSRVCAAWAFGDLRRLGAEIWIRLRRQLGGSQRRSMPASAGIPWCSQGGRPKQDFPVLGDIFDELADGTRVRVQSVERSWRRCDGVGAVL